MYICMYVYVCVCVNVCVCVCTCIQKLEHNLQLKHINAVLSLMTFSNLDFFFSIFDDMFRNYFCSVLQEGVMIVNCLSWKQNVCWFICMYVDMYVCVYNVCLFICMYVELYVCVYSFLDVSTARGGYKNLPVGANHHLFSLSFISKSVTMPIYH